MNMGKQNENVLFGLCIFSIFFVAGLGARAYIENFSSDITLSSSHAIDVVETIRVYADGYDIKHGIMREIPTDYPQFLLFRYHTPLTLKEVLIDGKAAKYILEYDRSKKGYVLRVGDKHTLLSPGVYTYRIHYTLGRVIGFFADHVELFHNVVGLSWRLPIAHAQAIVHLPFDFTPGEKNNELACYVGFTGSRIPGSVRVVDARTIIFDAGHSLQPFQGLTIALKAPKDRLVEPSMNSKIWWFTQDNGIIVLLMLLTLWIFMSAFRAWRRSRSGTIIPLFSAPNGYAPGACYYVTMGSYGSRGFAADLVDVAVAGGLGIEHKEAGWFKKAVYTLSRKDKAMPKGTRKQLRNTLFKTADSITVEKGGKNTSLHEAYNVLKNTYNEMLNAPIFGRTWYGFFWSGSWASLIWVIAVFLSIFLFASWIITISCIVLFFIAKLFGYYTYTQEGNRIYREIKGLKMYLETAEIERMNIIGTPPVKTPEVYETFLPYAIALGVEKAWTQQFASVFKQLEIEGHPYQPVWMGGYLFDYAVFSSFVSDVHSVSHAISSSGMAPGSMSGFSSSSGAGGGSGGGGGGGW